MPYAPPEVEDLGAMADVTAAETGGGTHPATYSGS